jgi:hypothetical protein
MRGKGGKFLQEPHGVTSQKTPFFISVLSLTNPVICFHACTRMCNHCCGKAKNTSEDGCLVGCGPQECGRCSQTFRGVCFVFLYPDDEGDTVKRNPGDDIADTASWSRRQNRVRRQCGNLPRQSRTVSYSVLQCPTVQHGLTH